MKFFNCIVNGLWFKAAKTRTKLSEKPYSGNLGGPREDLTTTLIAGNEDPKELQSNFQNIA